jgi:biotin carboxyl carrier protein
MERKILKTNNSKLMPGISRYYVDLDDEIFEVYIRDEDSERISVKNGKDQKSYRIMPAGNADDVFVQMGEKAVLLSFDMTEGQMSVFLGCREGKLKVNTERDLLLERHRSAAQSSNTEQHIISPLPGLVTKIETEPDAELKKGQGIAIIEAMKMENEITAPRDCKVIEIKVSEGEAIEKGKVIAVLE